jgi:2-keto-4-pentenoate hydratase
MTGLHPRIRDGMERQLDGQRRELAAGARRIGWKLGRGIGEVEELMGDRPVLGYLVSSSELAPDVPFRVPAERADTVRAETELGIAIGARVTGDDGLDAARAAIAGCCVALELVDVGPPRGDVEAVLAANVFHRAFAFGHAVPGFTTAGRRATLVVDGTPAGEGMLLDDYAQTVADAARLLAALGESLEPGDLLIAGSSVHVAVRPGDAVSCAIDGLGHLEARLR